MLDFYSEGHRRRRHFVLLLWILAMAPPTVLGYFLRDTKAVLKDCVDYWVLQGQVAVPLLYQLTVCVDIRVVVPGAWVAFSYSSVRAPRPDLGLEGDETALYGWLLRVRHRFPVRIFPGLWHRVCLKRDASRNSFSLEVDGETVAERTVIAQAIPSSGSLWLGCRPTDRRPGSPLANVELYLFRVWGDVSDHGFCEDGSVIGWDSEYWGVTSAKARERDPSLICAISPEFGRWFPSRLPALPQSGGPTQAPHIEPPAGRLIVTGSPPVRCDITQLCSDEKAYYWMFLNVEVTGHTKTENDIYNWLADACACDKDGRAKERANFAEFCQRGGELQKIEVSCQTKQNIRQTGCGVLLQLRRALPVCRLQLAVLSVLQQAANPQIQASLVGELDRVGHGVCEDLAPSGGHLVRCSSPSSLDDFCQSGPNATLTCSLVDPTKIAAPSPTREPCSRKEPGFCDCKAFCSDTRQFFALSVNISSSVITVEILQRVLSRLGVAAACDTASQVCRDFSEVSKHYKGSHLECHGTKQRLYSCMVVLEMLAAVNVCPLAHLLQLHMNSLPGITEDRPLARMVVCGPPDLPVSALLASNLTWVASDLLTSEICLPNRSLLTCEANETLAVLLTETCQDPRTAVSSIMRSLRPSPVGDRSTATAATATSMSGVTQRGYATARSNAPVQLKKQSGENAGTSLAPSASPAAQPVRPTNSRHLPADASQYATACVNSTAATPSPTPNVNTGSNCSNNTTHFPNPLNKVLTLNPSTPTQAATPSATRPNTHMNQVLGRQFVAQSSINSTPPTPTQTPYLQHTVVTQGHLTTLATINSGLPTLSPNTNSTVTQSNTTQPTTCTDVNSTLPLPTQSADVQQTASTSGNITQLMTAAFLNSTLPASSRNTTLQHTPTKQVTAKQPTTRTLMNATLPVPNTNGTTSTTQLTTGTKINSTMSTTAQVVHHQHTTTSKTTVTTFTPICSTLLNLTTSSENNRTLQNTTSPQTIFMCNTTALFPNHSTINNISLAAKFWNLLNFTIPRNATLRSWRTFPVWTNHTRERNKAAVASSPATTAIHVPQNTTRSTGNATTTPKPSQPSYLNITTTTKTEANVSLSQNLTSWGMNLNRTATEHGHNVTRPNDIAAITTTAAMAVTGNSGNTPMTTTASTTARAATISTSVESPPQAQTHNSASTEPVMSLTSATPLQTSGLIDYITTVRDSERNQTEQNEHDRQINSLLDQTRNASNLTSSQVELLVTQLENLLRGPTVSRSMGQKVLNVISNLMEADPAVLSASSNRLIQLVDTLGVKLLVTSDSEILSSTLLVLAVRTVDWTNFPATSVQMYDTDNIQLHTPPRSLSRSSETPMGSVYLPSSLTQGLSEEEQQQASRVQFTFFTSAVLFQDEALDNRTTTGPVLGCSVANLSISNLSENIQFTIRNINPPPANSVASCVFWDFHMNAGGGGWNPTGCTVLSATEEAITCSCDHLTSFAILLDVSREGIADRHQGLILTFITYIGCGISAVFLAVTLLTYLSFEKLLRDIPSKILVQLCLSLLFLNLVFLLDGWLALYPAAGLCISTAFFLHYFLLTSFTWAGLEALHMYLSIVRVFTPYLSKYMLKFSLLGWGVPLIVVVIVIAVDKDNYGLVMYGKYTDGTSDDFCWLRSDIAFYVGVVAYFLLIFALCLAVFIVVLVQLQRIKRQNPQNQSPNRGPLKELRSIAGLIILLGLTWGFALFAWGPLYLPFVYLFAILNSLQGFFIFVLHCAVKENVRRQWRTYLCCKGLRLAENSDWSGTATHKIKKLSVNTSTTPTFGPASRSSSVISERSSSTGSVFADSGISDSSNSDVVLNEMHRRDLGLPNYASNNIGMILL